MSLVRLLVMFIEISFQVLPLGVITPGDSYAWNYRELESYFHSRVERKVGVGSSH